MAQDLHKTGETVRESGSYICAVGELRNFQTGDEFPACPHSGKETTWRHADHVHKSGDEVSEAGVYRDEDGDTATFAVGDTFPNCPKSGNPTEWKHASN